MCDMIQGIHHKMILVHNSSHDNQSTRTSIIDNDDVLCHCIFKWSIQIYQSHLWSDKIRFFLAKSITETLDSLTSIGGQLNDRSPSGIVYKWVVSHDCGFLKNFTQIPIEIEPTLDPFSRRHMWCHITNQYAFMRVCK